jgi:hypothetical protein
MAQGNVSNGAGMFGFLRFVLSFHG